MVSTVAYHNFITKLPLHYLSLKQSVLCSFITKNRKTPIAVQPQEFGLQYLQFYVLTKYLDDGDTFKLGTGGTLTKYMIFCIIKKTII